MAEKKLVGKIIHFYPKISVAVVELADSLKTGDRISIERAGQAFEQTVDSIEVEHEKIPSAKKGQSVGLKVLNPTKEGAQVYKVTE